MLLPLLIDLGMLGPILGGRGDNGARSIFKPTGLTYRKQGRYRYEESKPESEFDASISIIPAQVLRVDDIIKDGYKDSRLKHSANNDLAMLLILIASELDD